MMWLMMMVADRDVDDDDVDGADGTANIGADVESKVERVTR